MIFITSHRRIMVLQNNTCISWKIGTFEQTCLRKPHEQVVGRIVGANNIEMLEY